MTELRLARLSICPCGYGVLKDSIPLGTIYRVDLDSVHPEFYYTCGRCGKDQRVTVALCSQVLHPGRPAAFLPLALFGSAHKVCPVCSAMYDAKDETCNLHRRHNPKLRHAPIPLRAATDTEECDFIRFS